MKSKSRLTWPTGLRPTRVRLGWFERFAQVESGLDLGTLARSLRTSYTIAQRWAQIFKYEIRDRRRECQVDWNRVNWDLRDAVLARELGLTRERVRQVRTARQERPSLDVQACKAFVDFATRNVTALQGLPLALVIEKSEQPVKRGAASRILRRLGVEPHRVEPRWRHFNWQLPNRDLARIHGLDARQVASIRSRLRVGPAMWDVAGGRPISDAAYQVALEGEARQFKQGENATGKESLKFAVNPRLKPVTLPTPQLATAD